MPESDFELTKCTEESENRSLSDQAVQLGHIDPSATGRGKRAGARREEIDPRRPLRSRIYVKGVRMGVGLLELSPL
jgi:hypothetical protein